MVTERGQAKILDFGLAKLVHEGGQEALSGTLAELTTSSPGAASSVLDSLTRGGAAVGTPAYMSPEQVSGHSLDPRTDLFSLGLVLYEMATRRRAFEGESRERLLEKVLTYTPPPPSRANPELPPAFDDIIRKLLEKDRELRYQTAADVRADLKRLRRDSGSAYGITPAAAQTQRLDLRQGFRPSWFPARWVARLRQLPMMARLDLTTSFILVLAVVVGLLVRAIGTPALTERDVIVLSDFDNTTGDSVFDGALKQALAVQLGQSPFLNILAENQVRESLRYMGRPPESKISREVAREICFREGVKALIAGSISRLGTHYVLALQVVEAQTDGTLASEQAEVASKEEVLKGLDRAASRLRAKMGESFGSIARFDVPLDRATTPSLEALRAFSLGNAERAAGREYESIAFSQRALELDPQFALAEARLSTVYGNLEETSRAIEHGRRAYELRDRVSDRERYYITAQYYGRVMGDMEKAMGNYEMWKRAYPRDSAPVVNLAAAMNEVGQFERALEEAQLASNTVNSNRSFAAINIAAAHMGSGRFNAARQVLDQMLVDNPASASPRVLLFMVACATDDSALMRQQLDRVDGKESEPMMHLLEAQSVASGGELRKAREIFAHAGDMALRFNRDELAATARARESWVEAEFGNPREAQTIAEAALRGAKGKDPIVLAALALARAGDTARAGKIADDMEKQFPSDSIMNAVSLLSIRAAIELNRGNPHRAIELLKAVIPYELGFAAGVEPTYLRGLAYLNAGDGPRAAEEFDKIIARPGVEAVSPIHALARLGLARAHALAGDPAKSQADYQEFLTRWKSADPTVPILKQAQSAIAPL
jgi:tetratricopeptide (TPR) repeat protein